MKQEHNESRRQFIQKSTVCGTGIILSGAASQRLIAQENQPPDAAKRVASKGYGARDTSGKLSSWTFERRPVGDEDILIEISSAAFAIQTFTSFAATGVRKNIRKFRGTRLPESSRRSVRT